MFGCAMNAFEMSHLITPISGAVGGGIAVKAHGTVASVSGIVIGLLVGIAVIVGLRWLIGVLGDRMSVEAQNRHQWLGLMMVLFVSLALPVVAFSLSSVLVVTLFRL